MAKNIVVFCGAAPARKAVAAGTADVALAAGRRRVYVFTPVGVELPKEITSLDGFHSFRCEGAPGRAVHQHSCPCTLEFLERAIAQVH